MTKTSGSDRKRSFVTNSTNFEDLILDRLFGDRNDGFYIDIGAGHPCFDNDTYNLYLAGWSGINVEPNTQFQKLHAEMRPRDTNLGLVLTDDDGTEELSYFQIGQTGLSTCDRDAAAEYIDQGMDVEERSVRATTLGALLSEHGGRTIDLLKVDVEGFEEKTLRTVDWSRYRPRLIVVEATLPNTPIRRETGIRELLESNGYRHVHFDGLNEFYAENGFDVGTAFDLPPNVFDHFTPRETVELRKAVESLEDTQRSAAASFSDALQRATEEKERIGAELADALAKAETVDSLTVHNRRLSNQLLALEQQNKRLYAGAAELRTENLALGRSLQETNAALREEHSKLRAAFDEASVKMQQDSAQLPTLNELIRSQIGEIEALNMRLHQFREDNRKISEDHRNIIAERQRIYQSTSWKISRPIRVFGRFLKRILRRISK